MENYQILLVLFLLYIGGFSLFLYMLPAKKQRKK